MKTEKEIYILVKECYEKINIAYRSMKISNEEKDRESYNTVYIKYNEEFDIFVKVLDVDRFTLWREMSWECKNNTIPLHTRLSKLMNPAPKGNLLK